MQEIGKLLVVCGVVIAVIGMVVIGLARIGFRGLPGDVAYRSDHVRVYFPIVTCIVISVILTLANWLYHWIGRK